MDYIIPIPDTCEKNERGYFSSSLYREKPLSGSQKSFFFPEIVLGRQVVKQGKTVLIFVERGFGGG
jgi:hypothetical protein